MRLPELAAQLGAELVFPGSGDASAIEIGGVGAPLHAVESVLVFAEGEAALAAAYASRAGAVITSPQLAGDGAAKPMLLVRYPRLAFARAAELLRPLHRQQGIHPSAHVDADATLEDGVLVGPNAVIEHGVHIGACSRIDAGVVIGARVHIGRSCHLYPRVVLYPGTHLGNGVIVHAGAVLGSDGFGYVRDDATGEYTKFPQQGRLVIEDDVEIGANTTIDRGALEETRIGRGTKLDNLVHVGHNVTIGRNVVIAAQTGVSGSSTIGDGAIVGGQVGIADHVEIGPGAILGAQAGIPTGKRIHGPGVVFWGTPARPIKDYLKELATLARLTRRPK
ncbi:MAG TPA: UDP-3-O-(3-hydroxymyristoyl)glucosamine N-acyltransferase [Acidobacteriaceae bacterium]|jgi:UDP-3-O-[3-hydroxymyristoyl] glucosamine N-acyltransferase